MCDPGTMREAARPHIVPDGAFFSGCARSVSNTPNELGVSEKMLQERGVNPGRSKLRRNPARERDKARVGRDGAAGLSGWTPELGPHVCVVAPKPSGDSLLKDNSGASAGGGGGQG